ncbi:asparagine synthase (glutamine-hydrolyzing) [archaeon]|nr:asparagine synthase (glutamine-hydrolyzing) [archaeon]MBT6773670.1 asparagine synthase (glutamine-hydrolyzing) [archaeon]
MCGVIGFNWDDKTLLKKLSNIIEHRGPDDVALYTDRHYSLGMRRLAILDLKKGLYPIYNESETILTVFNGELYNYKKIRAELIKLGHKFKTDCDAEIIPHAYEEYGPLFVNKINGMFAICLYDLVKKKLFLFRDRLGIKPLYYYFEGKRFAFCSEIKALLVIPKFQKEINESALNNYFTFRYVPGEDSIFSKIKKVLPGHYLEFDGKIKIKKYWDLHFSKNNNSLEKNAIYVKNLLEHSVKRRLMSDVPLGAYLSGGLDSSAIVALMSKHSNNVNTFNVSFSDSEFDESKYAQIVADEFNTNHEVIDVDVNAIDTLPKVAYHLDEPLADAATIPTYLMSQQTKKKVTVVLSGEGSDELFAGYERYRHMNAAFKFKQIPKFIRNIPSKIKSDNIVFNRGKEVLSKLDKPKDAFLSYFTFFNDKDKKLLYSKNINKKNYDLNEYFGKSIFNSMLKLDVKERLPGNMLLKNDKMTMAASLEARVPFLDHELVEFSSKIPFNQKITLFKDKLVYRESIKKIVPKIIYKRKKTGFTVPTSAWVKEGLKDHLFDLVEQNKEPYLNKNYIKKISDKVHKHFYYKRQFWSILMYEQWYNEFMVKR